MEALSAQPERRAALSLHMGLCHAQYKRFMTDGFGFDVAAAARKLPPKWENVGSASDRVSMRNSLAFPPPLYIPSPTHHHLLSSSLSRERRRTRPPAVFFALLPS
jgi:hypothetical protein